MSSRRGVGRKKSLNGISRKRERVPLMVLLLAVVQAVAPLRPPSVRNRRGPPPKNKPAPVEGSVTSAQPAPQPQVQPNLAGRGMGAGKGNSYGGRGYGKGYQQQNFQRPNANNWNNGWNNRSYAQVASQHLNVPNGKGKGKGKGVSYVQNVPPQNSVPYYPFKSAAHRVAPPCYL